MRTFTQSIRRIATAIAFSAVSLALVVPTAGAAPRDPVLTASNTASTAAVSCDTPIGTPGYIQALQFNKRNWPLTGGLHMDTRGSVNRNNGVVSGTVHLYNSYWGMGYTGAMLVVLKDRCGGTIGVTLPQQWGVDAKSWFWNSNERTPYFSTQIDARIANRVASVEVVHSRVTGDEAINLYRSLRQSACIYLLTQGFVVCPLPMLR